MLIAAAFASELELSLSAPLSTTDTLPSVTLVTVKVVPYWKARQKRSTSSYLKKESSFYFRYYRYIQLSIELFIFEGGYHQNIDIPKCWALRISTSDYGSWRTVRIRFTFTCLRAVIFTPLVKYGFSEIRDMYHFWLKVTRILQQEKKSFGPQVLIQHYLNFSPLCSFSLFKRHIYFL